MRIPFRPGAFLLMAMLVALGAAGAAMAQGDGAAPEATSVTAGDESFASAFFISRVTNPDGSKSLDLFGSFLLWVLLALSVVSIGLIGMTAMTNQRKTYVPAGVVDQMKKLMNGGKFKEAIDLTAADQSFFSQVLHASLREAGHGYSAVIRSLEQTSDELTTVRLRRIEYLNILAQVSPMIGLFGTVWGMILAFRAIVMAGGNADPVLLAGGIGTALTTTFWGLIIAIPALSAYGILRNRIDEFTTDATRMAEGLLNEFRPAPKAGASSAAPTVRSATPTAPAPAPKPV